MKITDRNKQQYRVFLVFLGILSLGGSIGLVMIAKRYYSVDSVPGWLVAVMTVLIFLVLSWAFEKTIWRWPVFRYLGVVNFPDLSGRWVGFLTSSYRRNDQNVVIPMSLEITQDASSVYVRALFERSQSDSVVAEFEEVDGKTCLYYVYDNAIAKPKRRRHAVRDRG